MDSHSVKSITMKPLFILLLFIQPVLCTAQAEASAAVTAINNNILMLENCIDAEGQFKVNQKIIIVQKEGASSIVHTVANTNKSATGKQVPKKYLVLTITEVERNDNTVTSIKVSRDLQNSFIVNNFSTVDIHIVTCRWNW